MSTSSGLKLFSELCLLSAGATAVRYLPVGS